MPSLETDERPWGRYEVLADKDYCKVKEIFVLPGQRLSYQSHQHRKETWTVVQGILTVIIDGYEVVKGPGQSVKIPLGAKHRAWNKGQEECRFIEVQSGTYFGEDDIIRYEDDYGRTELEHLKDHIDVKEDQLKNKTNWWKKMKKNG